MLPINEKIIIERMRSEGFTYSQIGEVLEITRHKARGIIVNLKTKFPKKRGRKLKITKSKRLNIKRCISQLQQSG